MTDTHTHKRQRTSITLPADMLKEAKTYDLNISRLAEKSLVEAIKAEKEKEWISRNQAAIDGYNNMVKKEGLFLDPDWIYKDE